MAKKKTKKKAAKKKPAPKKKARATENAKRKLSEPAKNPNSEDMQTHSFDDDFEQNDETMEDDQNEPNW